MSLKNQSELTVTREKLRLLEESYQAAKQDTNGNARVREIELRSLKQLINQLKEEIVRFEAHAGAT